MVTDHYEELAEALNKLPNGFPRTESKVEIKILQKIFTSDEAALASKLGREYETLTQIMKRAQLPEEQVKAMLDSMADRGLLWSSVSSERTYRLAPWIVGIYESQVDSMDHEFAHLIERYFDEGGAAGIMKPYPAIHRVVPARGAAKTEWVLPYDDVKLILESKKSFRNNRCICKAQQELIGAKKCSFPLDLCISFSSEEPHRPGDLTKEEAIKLLDRAEELGLVHTVSNVINGVGYVCNCCGCCCGVLRGITDYGIDSSVAHANYFAEVDEDTCIACGLCTDRCQVGAISLENGKAEINRNKCIGCGLCASKCPTSAAKLTPKPKGMIVEPPVDFKEWEKARLHSRGLV